MKDFSSLRTKRIFLSENLIGLNLCFCELSMSELAYIYLLQDGKDKGTNIFKVGRTIQKGGDGRKLKRLQGYSNGTVPYNTWKVDETTIIDIEKEIKELFKEHYHLVRGSEWFDGDVKQMKIDIDSIIERFEKERVDDGTHFMTANTCSKCMKTFSRQYYLRIHEEKCDGIRKGMCKYCKESFKNRSALDRHKKVCKTTVQSPCKDATNTTIVNNNTVNVLVFPEDDDEVFDFRIDNITQSIMKKCVTSNKPQLGFNKFMSAVLDIMQNRFVRKSNANCGYSSVHRGDGRWELIADAHVYPYIIRYMTTAALAKLEEFKQSLRFMCDNFHRLVDNVNTDDECQEYQAAIYDLKLLVVNMTRQLEAVEKRGLTSGKG